MLLFSKLKKLNLDDPHSFFLHFKSIQVNLEIFQEGY